MILECCGISIVSLFPVDIRLKNGPYVQEFLEAIILPTTLAIVKILGPSKLDSES